MQSNHLLFLNKDEIDPYGEQSCHTLVYESGCVYQYSYFLAFKEQFWEEEKYEYSEDLYVSEYASEG